MSQGTIVGPVFRFDTLDEDEATKEVFDKIQGLDLSSACATIMRSKGNTPVFLVGQFGRVYHWQQWTITDDNVVARTLCPFTTKGWAQIVRRSTINPSNKKSVEDGLPGFFEESSIFQELLADLQSNSSFREARGTRSEVPLGKLTQVGPDCETARYMPIEPRDSAAPQQLESLGSKMPADKTEAIAMTWAYLADIGSRLEAATESTTATKDKAATPDDDTH